MNILVGLGEERVFPAGQNKDCDQGGGETRCSANTKRPARAEVIGDPSHDRSAYRGSPKRDANT